MAGAHMLDAESGEYNLPILRRLFVGRPLCVITLAEREQGLIVAAGNPMQISGLASLQDSRIRYVNRQPASGTRALLDHYLARQHIPASTINGFSRELPTHTAVADAVARGAADAGLGVRAAAHAFGLDFVPLTYERYDLVVLAEDRHRPPVVHVIDCLASREFRDVVANLSGYSAVLTGNEIRI